jgi:hypothetical protein
VLFDALKSEIIKCQKKNEQTGRLEMTLARILRSGVINVKFGPEFTITRVSELIRSVIDNHDVICDGILGLHETSKIHAYNTPDNNNDHACEARDLTFDGKFDRGREKINRRNPLGNQSSRGSFRVDVSNCRRD